MPKPFLKWVGGKRRMLPVIAKHLPEDFYEREYVEPFLGGGAVFFGLRKPGQATRLSDSNSGLIQTYLTLQSDPHGLIAKLIQYTDTSKVGYQVVRGDYNSLDVPPLTRAAMFVYLNRMGYRGLWRENRQGQYNTPYGDNPKAVVCDTLALLQCHQHLDSAVEIYRGSYLNAFIHATSVSFLYLDPPYASEDDVNFTSYTPQKWTCEHQTELAKACRNLPAGAKFLASNADVPYIRALYKGFNIKRITAGRKIGGNRQDAPELLISNY